MKKFFLLIMASLTAVSMMAVGTGDGSTKANAIEFDWDKGNVHAAGTKWYHVDLAPLYEEENPSLTLYVTNPSRDESVQASMTATVAGETETKKYTVSPHEHQIYSANATMLVRLHQTEIYLTLTTDGEVLLSAKVFETTDLDETCKDAKELKWDTETTQTKGYAAWWKVDLRNIKDTVAFAKKDARVTIANIGTRTVNLKTGQSLDCPSSGLTKRNYTLAPGDAIVDTIPQSMILSVYPDELYFSIENLEAPVRMKVEMVDQPVVPIIPGPSEMAAVEIKANPADTTIEGTTIAAGQTLFAFSVADFNALAKYEPEFTYRNENGTAAHVTTKMAFARPAFGTTNANYTIAAGEEEVVVYKKNMLDGMTGVDSIYLLTIADQPIKFLARYKHVREGKACKTNIDFNWESGHTQEARTTQWYAINVADARDNQKDIVVYVQNLGAASATVKASMAFSCPYIDLQEVTRSIAASTTASRKLGFSSYAMMSDTVWIGLETSQDIKFWADTVPAETQEPDEACLNAVKFDWDNGVKQQANDTVWYVINMKEALEKSAKFPTVFVQNLSTSNAVKIEAELSLECPDSIKNEKRTLTIAANGSYSKQLSRNLFENISQPEIYLRVIASEEISLQIRLTEEAAGASCSSAIPFNWASGNTQAANANLWYVIDLQPVIERGNDLKLHLLNRDNAKCEGFIQLAYSCPLEDATSLQNFTLAPNAQKDATIRNSAIEAMTEGVVYVNISGNTSLRFWADTMEVVPFDTIFADGLTLTPLKWNETYTQTADTAWYIIPQSEIDYVRNLEEKVKPVAHLIDASASAKTLLAEAAFAFPIGKKMMGKTQELKANQHFVDTIPAGTFDQVLKHDSIILRIIRTKGTGAFQFKTELVKAFNGNSPKDAQPIRMNALYTQSPNTEMWYKLKTADLKKDKDLYNKIMHVMSKNAGAGDAKVKVAVYDGYKAKYEKEDDLFMDRGEKTIKKGQGKSHNFPAQAVYGLGDVELYIKVRTTDSLVFETKTVGTYAAQDVDPEQAKAKLVVPNVEYTIPGDNQNHWYMVCLPYIQNNYKYVDASSLTYEVEGVVTLEATATFQDEMNCKMPVRKRTVNKSGNPHKGTKPLRELIDRAIKKAGYSYDVSGTAPDYIDSMLHRFITKDSVTLYVRLKSDKPIKVTLNTPQTKGLDDDCINAMSFDWEHGNVNPKDQHTWYVVALDTVKLYEENKSLRLHVDNWSETDAADATASLYFKCGDAPVSDPITKNIPAGDSLKKDISIDFIKASKPQLMFIDFNSTQTTHIWIEKVDVKRDTVYADTTYFVCKDTIIGGKEITVDTEWNDTIRNIKDDANLRIYDSICTVKVFIKREPKKYDFSSKVTIQRKAVLDLAAADTWVRAQIAADANDTVQKVTALKWQYAVYPDATYKDVDLANQPTLYAERVNVQYVITTECQDEFECDTLHNIARDTVYKDECNFFKWDANDSLYVLPTEANPDSVVKPGYTAWGDSIVYLSLKLTNPATMDLIAIAKYGNRLLLINRHDFLKKGFETEPIYAPGGAVKVEWFNAKDPEHPVAEGYSYNNPDGSPLVGTFYAVITVTTDADCGFYGRTQDLVLGATASGVAPALAPSIVMPGEDIKVTNLDPEKETLIRIYTTEGLIQHTYNVRGQETFTIKAANAHGFYLVELLTGDEKSTLRYIVK